MNLTSLKLIAKTNWSWLEAPTGYLNSNGYTFKINFYKNASNSFSITGVNESDQWRMAITSAVNIYASGLYQWQAIATKDGLDTPVASGTITTQPNLADETDPRGVWTRIYQNLMGAYEKLSTKIASEVTLDDGTHVTYADLPDLIRRIKFAESKMNEETGRRISKKILGKFY